MICLDTNIVIAILNRNPEVAQHRLVAALSDGDKVAISAVVFFELRFGVEGSNRREHGMDRLDLFLASPVDILPFDADDAAEAATIRIALKRAGRRSARSTCSSRRRRGGVALRS